MAASAYELAADILQKAICKAVCDQDSVAKDWLLLRSKPTFIEIASPTPGSFIAICRLLGLNWLKLSDSLREAVAIEPAPERGWVGPRITRKHLTLVPSSEPVYTGKHDQSNDREGSSGTPKSKH